MNGHINETAPPLVPIGEVKLVQVQIVVWFVRTCEVWILFVFLEVVTLSFFAKLFSLFCLQSLVNLEGVLLTQRNSQLEEMIRSCGTWRPLILPPSEGFLLSHWPGSRSTFRRRTYKTLFFPRAGEQHSSFIHILAEAILCKLYSEDPSTSAQDKEVASAKDKGVVCSPTHNSEIVQ